MKIAVVGAGSSGLITLKYLQDTFPDAELVCFEKSHSVRGCWGDQRPDFISTSTKYTTQFSCFRQWGPDVSPAHDYAEFFRGGEFGDYLEAFAEHFDLYKHIRFGVEVQHVEESEDGWTLRVADEEGHTDERFDAVFLCTGLVNQPASLGTTPVPIADDPEAIRNATVVVVGGGESAADVANHLAKPAHGNTVYLSLRSGIRVSPRYHPIRGVPSDFLRNRLLLSFRKGPRNWIGERFVTFRIRFDQGLARWFPHQHTPSDPDKAAQARRRHWDLQLKARAKGRLFNVFHNKSDDFLEAVAEERLFIIGPRVDEVWKEYYDFNQETTLTLSPDVLVPTTGYHSRLSEMSRGRLHLKDFYHGCVHTEAPNLFLIGFARPIIGNIPSISEMQARYAVGVLAGQYALPADVKDEQARAWKAHCAEYPALDTENVYPVEQYPYSDVLAREMGMMPTLGAVSSLRRWLKIMLAPASSTHYVDAFFDASAIAQQKIYTPPVLIGILALMRLFGLPLRGLQRLRKRPRGG